MGGWSVGQPPFFSAFGPKAIALPTLPGPKLLAMTAAARLDTKTADTLRQALSAAQGGDLIQACQLAEAGLAAGEDVVALNAFLGMVRARAGDRPRGILHLQKAHAGRPTDGTIACNLIAALIESGDLQAALAVASPELASADASLRIGRYRGFIAQSLGRFETAAAAYEHVLEAAPRDFESWNNLGNARQALGDLSGSVAALQQAVRLDPRAAPARLNLAAALGAANRYLEAEEVLAKAAADFPQDAKPLAALYLLHKRQEKGEQAREALKQAVEREPEDSQLWLKLAVEHGLMMRADEAEGAYRRAIAIDPKLIDAYLGLAINYEHSNRGDELPPLIALAEKNGVEPHAIEFIRALELRRSGRFDEALASLSRVPAAIEPERSAQIRGTLLDRLGRADDAMGAFAEANRLHAQHPSDPLRRAAEWREELRGDLSALSAEWLTTWASTEPLPSTRVPVFLVGFPRSGTTLLDTILMGHSQVQVMEERPPLTLVEEAIGGLRAIPGLTAEAIVAAREHYFAASGAYWDLGRPGLLIDKSPLYLNKVPIIHRLFPEARFILALRHPCDVLLSCFMSNFRLNAAMSNFLRLEDAADFYDLTFTHWEKARSLIPLNVHTIFYERMIEESESELRPLFDFLGLGWRDEVLDHQRTAASRGLITTASYSQVTEPIYKRAAGRWERYRRHLEPVLPTLAPWVEKFGYSL